MKLSLKLPFWLIATIQVLLFIFIIFNVRGIFDSALSIFPFLLLEILVFAPFVFKFKKRYFYIFWEIQLFAFILVLIIFNFKATFNTEDANLVTIGFFTFALLLVQSLLLSYLIFGERSVKKILLTLASSTTVIVFLIVFFVMLEGVPAIQENGFAEMVTGTDFQPFYEIDDIETHEITTTIMPYEFFIHSDDQYSYLQTNSEKNISIFIENSGAKEDNFQLDLDYNNGIFCSLNHEEINIPAYETYELELSVESKEVKNNFPINVICKSEKGDEEKTYQIDLIVSDYGLNIYPDIKTVEIVGSQQTKDTISFNITNTGIYEDECIVTLEILDEESENEFAYPSINSNKNKWDFTNSYLEIKLDPGEEDNLIVSPRKTGQKEGTFYLEITASSKNNDEIIHSATIEFKHFKKRFANIQSEKNIESGQTGIYPIYFTGYQNDILVFKIDAISNNWEYTLKQEGSVILNGEGQTDISLDKNGTAYAELWVSGSGEIGDSSTITITSTKKGSLPSFGIFPFILGTILVTLIAIAIAAPLGIGCAIFLAEFCPAKVRKFLRPLYELLAGIPSVIYGLWGFITFGPWIANTLYPLITNSIGKHIEFFSETNQMGRAFLTAGIVLAIMILPIIITLSEDAIRSVRSEFKEGSLALGGTRWQTMRRVILPSARSGIVSSIILGTGRAIGETMAVLMIMSHVTSIPDHFFEPVGTMTSVIAAILPSTFDYDLTRHALFAIGMILFFMIFSLNILIYIINRRSENRFKAQKNNSRFSKIYRRLSALIFLLASTSGYSNAEGPKEEIDNDDFIILEEETKEKEVKASKPSVKKHKNRSKSILKFASIEDSKKSLKKEKVAKIFLYLCAIIITIFVIAILQDVVVKGGLTIKPEYLFLEEARGGTGGIANAIVGSLQMVGLAIGIALPLSLGAAIYVQEYAKKSNIFTKIILFTSDTLASTPSIVFGAFGFILFVWILGFGYSILAGALTLAFMVIPLMLRSSIEAIKAIPVNFQEGSLALGATKWQTICRVVLPPALPGIISGVIISIGRAMGETAAIMFTAGYSQSISTSIMEPAGSLPNAIYIFFNQSVRYSNLLQMAYATAFILIIIVLILNTISKIVYLKTSKMYKS